MCREGVFINPKKSGCIIALLLLITLGISVVNHRKYNTRLDEDEKIQMGRKYKKMVRMHY